MKRLGILVRRETFVGAATAGAASAADHPLKAPAIAYAAGYGRPDDRVGVAGIADGISNAHLALPNADGLGIVVGDGQPSNARTAEALKTCYSYVICPWARLTLDYQYIANPGYNGDRGPVNLVAARPHPPSSDHDRF